jgi:hypothetical protein
MPYNRIILNFSARYQPCQSCPRVGSIRGSRRVEFFLEISDFFGRLVRVGSGRVGSGVWWVGSGLEKWTHGQLCATPLAFCIGQLLFVSINSALFHTQNCLETLRLPPCAFSSALSLCINNGNIYAVHRIDQSQGRRNWREVANKAA